MMFRSVAITAALALAGVAQASESVDLYQTTGFGATHEYLNLPNSVGVDLDIVIGGTAGVNVEGDLFTGAYFGSGVPFVVTDADGAQLVVTINEASVRKCVKSGRGQTCHNVWTLASGTVSIP